jgi:TolB-like protein
MNALMRTLSVGLALLVATPALADKLVESPTVAVLYFDYDGKDPQIGLLRKGLAQMLISDLSVLEGIRIVERDRLEDILKELKLGQSGKIDKASAAKVGKLLGARYMVLGGYFDVMNTLRADARVVEVETGKVVQSVGATGKPDDFLTVEQQLATGLSGVLSKKLTAAAPAPTAPGPTAAPKKPRPKPPAKLMMKTAIAYSAALGHVDAGDKEKAKEALAAVVKEQPDFQLAAVDLDKLMQ